MLDDKQHKKLHEMLRDGWDFAKRLPDNAFGLDAAGERSAYLISKSDSNKAARISENGDVTEFVPVYDNTIQYPGGPNID